MASVPPSKPAGDYVFPGGDPYEMKLKKLGWKRGTTANRKPKRTGTLATDQDFADYVVDAEGNTRHVDEVDKELKKRGLKP